MDAGAERHKINPCSPSQLGHESSCTANALQALEDTLKLSLV